MKPVYVVAWEYDGGGGFDWYHSESAQKEAFEREKENVREFSCAGWKAIKFSHKVRSYKTATAEIDSRLTEFFAAASRSRSNRCRATG